MTWGQEDHSLLSGDCAAGGRFEVNWEILTSCLGGRNDPLDKRLKTLKGKDRHVWTGLRY